jgi:hypothetical protein
VIRLPKAPARAELWSNIQQSISPAFLDLPDPAPSQSSGMISDIRSCCLLVVITRQPTQSLALFLLASSDIDRRIVGRHNDTRVLAMTCRKLPRRISAAINDRFGFSVTDCSTTRLESNR